MIDTTGSLYVDDNWAYGTALRFTVNELGLRPVLNDTRRVRLDGLLFVGTTPCISCYAGGLTPNIANKFIQNTARDVIITDPGYIGTSAKLQDIQPEGSAMAYSRKIANGVRYLTVTVRIRASMPHYLGRLYRMASSPYQVLLVTDRTVIKGFIETIAPDQSAVGTDYISVKVTVAEGLR